MSRKTTILVYGTKKCPWTERAMHYIENLGLKDIQLHDVAKDMAARFEVVRLTRQYGTPVIVVGGNVVVGYDTAAIQKALVH